MANPVPSDPLPEESPLLWPALAFLVIAVGVFTYYWSDHRYQFPYSTTNSDNAAVWPPKPGQKITPPNGGLPPLEPPYPR